MFSIGMARTATGLAQSAVKSLSEAASSIGKSGSESPVDGIAFADVLASEKASSETSIRDIREKLTSAIESILESLGIPADPAMSFIAGGDGSIMLEGDHKRAVEIEGTLNDDSTVRSLVNRLSALASGADRRLVLHSIAQE
jgi:hypothetical protein